MCRGNRQEPVFRDNRDNEMFLDTLGEACGRCGWRVHAFCLMGNHYHVLLETPYANLVDGMRWLQGTFTKRFNIRHRVYGHLFQSRYKALLVDPSGDYFRTVSSYIHLNPARAGCFDLRSGRLSDYPWSSFPCYLNPSCRPEWLNVIRTLGDFGLNDDGSGLRQYEQAMQKRVEEILNSSIPGEAVAQWEKIRRGWCYGGDSFRSKMVESLDVVMAGKCRASFGGDPVCRHDALDAERLVQDGLRLLGLQEADLTRLKKGNLRKQVIAWMVRKNTSVKNSWIAERLEMGHASNLSRQVHEVDVATSGELFRLREITK
jgi:REP element-mobilizing transposase RayT